MTALILIADDDFDNRTIAQQILEAAGYRTLLAVNGLEAVALNDREKPDLLLLDLSMPKMNGWDVAKKIRQDEKQGHLPIIAFTAHALAGEAEKAKAAGCDEYLAKPCAPKEIAETVKRLLRRTAPETEVHTFHG
jgi:two-component system cell cycle response regulator DivK